MNQDADYLPDENEQDMSAVVRREFLQRLVAGLLDGMVIVWLGVMLFFLLYALVGRFLGWGDGLFMMSLIFILYFGWAYVSLCEASHLRATIGKRVMGLTVTDEEGEPITFGKATLRYFISVLSLLPLGAGFWWGLVNRTGMAWQDAWTNTHVMGRDVEGLGESVVEDLGMEEEDDPGIFEEGYEDFDEDDGPHEDVLDDDMMDDDDAGYAEEIPEEELSFDEDFEADASAEVQPQTEPSPQAQAAPAEDAEPRIHVEKGGAQKLEIENIVPTSEMVETQREDVDDLDLRVSPKPAPKAEQNDMPTPQPLPPEEMAADAREDNIPAEPQNIKPEKMEIVFGDPNDSASDADVDDESSSPKPVDN